MAYSGFSRSNSIHTDTDIDLHATHDGSPCTCNRMLRMACVCIECVQFRGLRSRTVCGNSGGLRLVCQTLVLPNLAVDWDVYSCVFHSSNVLQDQTPPHNLKTRFPSDKKIPFADIDDCTHTHPQQQTGCACVCVCEANEFS